MNQEPSTSPLPYKDSKATGAADFYFAINATFRFILKKFGHAGLVRYWQNLGADYCRPVSAAWKTGGLPAVSHYWKAFFNAEPGSDFSVTETQQNVVVEIKVCPALKHLREGKREIVSCFCQQCFYVNESMAAPAGFAVRIEGGNGTCRQTFYPVSLSLPSQDLNLIKEVA